MGEFGRESVQRVVMRANQFVIGAFIARVLHDVGGYLEVGQNLERSEAAFFPIPGIVVQTRRSPGAPGGGQAVLVYEKIIMGKDVVGDALASGANLGLLSLISRQFVKDVPSEVMAIDLVRRSFAFPIPFLFDGRFVPFRMRAKRGSKLRFIGVANSPGWEAGNSSDAFEAQKRLHGSPCLGPGFRRFARGVPEGLGRYVQGGPQTIIITDLLHG